MKYYTNIIIITRIYIIDEISHAYNQIHTHIKDGMSLEYRHIHPHIIDRISQA